MVITVETKPSKFALSSKTVEANLVLTGSELMVTGRYTSDDLNRSLHTAVALKEQAFFRLSINTDGGVKFQISHQHDSEGEFAPAMATGRIEDPRIPTNWHALNVNQNEIPKMLYDMLYEFDRKRDVDGRLMLLKLGPSMLAEEIKKSRLRTLDTGRLRDLLRSHRTFGFDHSKFVRGWSPLQ